MVVTVAGLSAGVGLVIVRLFAHLPAWTQVLLGAAVLKMTFSLRELLVAAANVRRSLETDDLEAARLGLRALVSRNPDLESPLMVSVAVESVAENLTDSLVAPLVFFALLGLPGALAYRAVNTMDAMLGYHGENEFFGKAAARLDDLLNLIPSRPAGLLLCLAAALQGRGQRAWLIMWRQHARTESPNAGWPMAAMAGALYVRLEKRGHYLLGDPCRPLTPELIGEANRLVSTAAALAVLVIAIGLEVVRYAGAR
jgi:adenosylcobinamide-phosphate synthase